MSEQTSWGAVPHAVVSKILWSDDLQFLDRLRCQKVCRSWKSLLHERPTAIELTDFSTDLCVKFCHNRTGRLHVALHLDEDPPAILVFNACSLDSSTFRETFSACCRWLTLRARLIRKIELSNASKLWWSLVRQVLWALHVARSQTPSAVAVRTLTGPEFICTCGDLLVDTLVALTFEIKVPWQDLGKVAQMTHLTYLTLIGRGSGGASKPSLDKLSLLQIQTLANLHTLILNGFKEPDVDLQWLKSLRRLGLGAANTHTYNYDLTSCTQLTSLFVAWGVKDRKQHLLLPAGSTVQLQSLFVSAPAVSPGYLRELQNLQDAVKLTAVEFHNIYPANLAEGAWPQSMPQLNTIKADRVEDWAVLQPVGYSRLRHLDCQLVWGEGCLAEVPHEFSQLTQLETLRLLAIPGLAIFPACLLHLKQLSSLDIGYGMHDVGLDEEILRFSEFTALTKLHLRTCADSTEANRCVYSMGALAQLRSLGSLLGPDVLCCHSCSDI